ncbi:integral membrane protein [Phlyctema vagabunda]|uniref:Integral membrane protein n=1 Tax=Phlyctema vagabunda TaxID=108571 RepID=A0ABR4PIF3_9HELO
MSSTTIVYAGVPPDGITSNANNPYHAKALIGCIGAFLPLATIFLAVRLFTRTKIVGTLAIDDYVMVIAWGLSVALTASILDLLNYGLAKHIWDVPLTDLYPNFLRVNVIAAILFCAATGFAKCSVLLFYQRIFPAKTFQMVVWGIVAFTASYSIASVFVNIFSCNPIAKSWELKYATSGTCINRPVFYFAQAGLGIFTDFATVLAPLPIMGSLNMPFRQKVAVGGLLTTGGFVCIVSIIRLQSLYVLLRSTDLTYATTNALLWCVVELNMSIVGGCIPTMKPFMRKYLPNILGSSKQHYGSHGYASHGYGSRNRSGSHPLQSFDPSRSGKEGTTRTTVKALDSKKGDNESEEYIIQNTSGSDLNFGNIVKTIDYGYEEEAEATKRTTMGRAV